MQETGRLEDRISECGFSDMAVVLAVASYLGGQAILANQNLMSESQEIKKDGSTVGILDISSGEEISKYIASSGLNSVQFRSEENMPFPKQENPKFHGIFDDLDGSINPLIGGTNLHYISVGGVIHRQDGDEQIIAAAYLPFGDSNKIFFAEKGKGAHAFSLEDFSLRRIQLSKSPAQKNILLESGIMSPATLAGEQALHRSGFYQSFGITARDRVTGGIFQAVSGIRDSRQVILNIAPSHQADYCYILLSEAGAEVIGQDGSQMFSTSYALLSLAPSFVGDRQGVKDRYVEALRDYKGWSPGKVVLGRVCD